ncbi:VOC family protein [Paracoccus sp. (in: a-proteobacteria)]|uniref:VOC family protein n=2 Tax=Paracoccus sp. TaxID=267 RepID=UPI00333EA608
MAKIIHSMIRVQDEARSLAFYKAAFGLEPVERMDFDSFTLVYLANAESSFELELTVNKGREEPYDLGDGYGHMAVSVPDVDAEHQRLTDLGLAPRKLVDFAPGGQVIARFFFIKDPDGYEIEVLQRAGRYL